MADTIEPAFLGMYWQHMLSGAVAGTAEHCVMFPVDTIKTRLQTLRAEPCAEPRRRLQTPLRRVLRRVMQREGLGSLWRGMPAMAAAAGPSHGIYFAVYEAIKRRLEAYDTGGMASPIVYSVAGSLATVAADAIATPMDTVKQRQQLAGGSMSEVIGKMYRREGVGAFWASYRTTLIMNVPFTALYFTTYELGKEMMAKNGVGDVLDTRTHLICGAAAGAVASSVTTPLDVVKTYLQTQHVGQGVGGVEGGVAYNGGAVFATMGRIVKEEGRVALLKGLVPRVLYHTPSAAICWATYEAMNRSLGTDFDTLD